MTWQPQQEAQPPAPEPHGTVAGVIVCAYHSITAPHMRGKHMTEDEHACRVQQYADACSDCGREQREASE